MRNLQAQPFSITRRGSRRATGAALPILAMALMIATVRGQQSRFLSNRMLFPNSGGVSQTFSTSGEIDLSNPFFQSLGTNGRSCATCHQPGDGMSISAASVQQRFDQSLGLEPIFRTVDGSNCDRGVDVSTVAGRSAAYSLLRTRALIRIAIAIPPNADYQVIDVSNPYGCDDRQVISMYRRPLPATNLRFLSTVMSDGRESSPATGTTRILFSNYPTSLLNDLAHQSVDATTGHAQGDGTRPTLDEQQRIVNFETALFTAQAVGNDAGRLDVNGANGGPLPLSGQPFFISINSSLHFLLPQFEAPGGLVTPGDGQFSASIFNLFDAWAASPDDPAQAAVARGQAIFNSRPIDITGVVGINDDLSAGGLVPGGIRSLQGTCGTCHDTPNVGNHSFPTALDIGTGTPSPSNPSVNLGGSDLSYLPTITVCKTDPTTGGPTGDCKTTTDLGQALIDGRFDHVGKIKGPILRGLSARAPYFHNGSAQTLLDVVRFYEGRFSLILTPGEESDLVAFLSSL